MQGRPGGSPERVSGTTTPATAPFTAERAAWLRDPLTVRFDRRSLGVVLALLLLALLGVAGKLHQSSIGKWIDYLPSPAAQSGVMLGQARAVRSDEWLVGTPWMLSQVRARLPEENGNIGGARSPLLTSVPVSDVVGAFQPELWGFYLLDEARGFSWLWMYRLFGLLASFFLLLLLLTRSDVAVSLLGAVAICFASFTQWWFSTNLPELLIAMAASTFGALYIAQSRSKAGIVFGATVLTIWGAAFVFQIYPPFQVVCGYVALVIFVGLLAERERRQRALQMLGWRIGAVLASTVVLGIVFALAWRDSQSTLGALMATAYPGARSTTGGDQGIASVLNGLFELWRVGEGSFPAGSSNPSEAANFPVLFPLVLLAALVPSLARNRLEPLHVGLLALCIVLLGWMTLPLSPELATAAAKWSLLSFVPSRRALLGLGLASTLLVAVWLAAARRSPVGSPTVPALLTLACLVLGASLAVWLHRADPEFFIVSRLLPGVAVIGLVAWAVTRGRLWPYAVAVLLMAIPPATVNPLARGLDPLVGRASMKMAIQESRSRPGGVLWMVPGSFVLPQAFKANGLPVFGGATYLPDRARMHVLDPGERHAHIWNRYAHIQVNSVPGVARPRFSMIDAPGLYGIDLDVCSAAVTALGVTHVAYPAPPPASDLACLQPLTTGPLDGIWMYRRQAART